MPNLKFEASAKMRQAK